jgi:hypothetical protein
VVETEDKVVETVVKRQREEDGEDETLLYEDTRFVVIIIKNK